MTRKIKRSRQSKRAMTRRRTRGEMPSESQSQTGNDSQNQTGKAKQTGNDSPTHSRRDAFRKPKVKRAMKRNQTRKTKQTGNDSTTHSKGDALRKPKVKQAMTRENQRETQRKRRPAWPGHPSSRPPRRRHRTTVFKGKPSRERQFRGSASPGTLWKVSGRAFGKQNLTILTRLSAKAAPRLAKQTRLLAK